MPEAKTERSGLIFAVLSYGLWGLMPLYFIALEPMGPIEIVALRILLSLLFCVLLLTVTKGWMRFVALLRNKRLLWTMSIVGVLIFINWQVYVYAAITSQVVEAALGYFINPIITILLGVIFLREKVRPVQWVAVGVSGVAVIVLAVGLGTVPWIALTLAFSFGLYGFMKNRVGGRVDAVGGLTLETLWLAPVAIGQLIFVGMTGGIVFGTVSTGHTIVALLAGVVTALPLLLFAAAARRIPLIYMGFLQYFTPFAQFLVGVVILNEPMPLERWIGFALVWLALLILTVDMVRNARFVRRPPAAIVEA